MSYSIAETGVTFDGRVVLSEHLGKPESVRFLPRSRTLVVTFEDGTRIFRDGEEHAISVLPQYEDDEEDQEEYEDGGELMALYEAPVYSIDELDEDRIVFSMQSVDGVYVYDLSSRTVMNVELPISRLVLIKGTIIFCMREDQSMYRLDPETLTTELIWSKDNLFAGAEHLLTPDRFLRWSYENWGIGPSNNVIVRFYSTLEADSPPLFDITVDDLDPAHFIVSEDGSRFAFWNPENSRIQCYSSDGQSLYEDVCENGIELVHFIGNSLVLYTIDNDTGFRVRIQYAEDFSDGQVTNLDESVYAVVELPVILF
jgi:hypothetical protein